VKPIRYKLIKSSEVIGLLLLMLLAFGLTGCAYQNTGIQIIPVSNREVLALNADDVVQIMRRSGFSDNQIMQYGTDMRNGLAQSGAVEIRINKKVEAVFAVNGDSIYISTRLRGNFIYNIRTGWVGGGR
jgi:hypothetical protein